jgi:hypothetical protein
LILGAGGSIMGFLKGPHPFLNDPHPTRSPAILLAETDIIQFNKATQLNTKVIDFCYKKAYQNICQIMFW